MADSQERKFSPCRLIGFVGVLIVIAWSMLMGGGARMFIDIPSMAFIFGIAFFILLATFGTDFLKFLPQSLLTFVSSSTESNPRFAQIALFASRYILSAGLIGLLVGLIQMLRNLESPESIGHGMAVALLTTFYAIIISEIFCAFLYKAYSADDQNFQSKPLPLKNVALSTAVTALALILVAVMMISLASF